MRYEFITVDRFLQYPPAPADSKEEADDLPLKTDDTPDCYQLLESKKGNGTVSSPRNPLLYGRGCRAVDQSADRSAVQYVLDRY